MKRGALIDDARISGWLDRFSGYRQHPTKAKVQAWLDRFSAKDKDLAARILDCVEVISAEAIHDGYKRALESLPGWHPNKNDREGTWVFVGYGKAGQSGQAMVNVFREANGLTSDRFDYLFCTAVELPNKKLKDEDTIVFIDDFAGTGEQVCRNWRTMDELAAANARRFLILTAATDAAVDRIQEETELTVRVRFQVNKNENVFSNSCPRFNTDERKSLLPYCRLADSKNPKGWGDCGLLYVLHHKTPNNSIPILHTNHPRWRGLFPRNLVAAS